ncbi:MAG: hypothetical protein PHU14_15580 [Methylovulum sp.]|nr:hypothetical protein [Methylovulum sp.]
MAILPTHKTTIEYLEHCRIQAADERLVYVKRKDAVEQHFAIPYGNTSVLLLGPGTSITQQAARLLASQGMLLGFCAGGAYQRGRPKKPASGNQKGGQQIRLGRLPPHEGT